MVLKKNNFTFNGDHYLQINGTAMGTKMAPSYANIFMGKLEKQLLESSIERPLSWRDVGYCHVKESSVILHHSESTSYPHHL
jgi:hypothetical protein